jgi:hypothetical protein
LRRGAIALIDSRARPRLSDYWTRAWNEDVTKVAAENRTPRRHGDWEMMGTPIRCRDSRLNRQRGTHRLLALVVVLALVASAFVSAGLGAGVARADETDEGAVKTTAVETPVADEAAEVAAPPVETETGEIGDATTESPEASDPIIAEADAPADPSMDEPVPEPAPGAAPIQETAVVEPPASPATLDYAPAAHPECVPSDEQEPVIAHGGFLDYDCAVAADLSGTQLPPSAVQIDWSVTASVAGGWAVQLRPPPAHPDLAPEWTPADADAATFTHVSGLADNELGDTLAPFSATESLDFGLRVHRATCGVEAQPVTLHITLQPFLAGLDNAVIPETAGQPQPITVSPELAPIPEPSLAISGSLDFGEVAVDAFGVRRQPAPRTLTVVVDGLDQACGTWRVDLQATALGSADGVTVAESGLSVVSIDDEPLADGVCPLDGGCTVAIVEAGPEVDSSVTYTLGVSLVLPDQARAATFRSTLTARLAKVTT